MNHVSSYNLEWDPGSRFVVGEVSGWLYDTFLSWNQQGTALVEGLSCRSKTESVFFSSWRKTNSSPTMVPETNVRHTAAVLLLPAAFMTLTADQSPCRHRAFSSDGDCCTYFKLNLNRGRSSENRLLSYGGCPWVPVEKLSVLLHVRKICGQIYWFASLEGDRHGPTSRLPRHFTCGGSLGAVDEHAAFRTSAYLIWSTL